MTEINTEQGTASEESVLENEKVRYASLFVGGLVIGVVVGVLISGGALTGAGILWPS